MSRGHAAASAVALAAWLVGWFAGSPAHLEQLRALGEVPLAYGWLPSWAVSREAGLAVYAAPLASAVILLLARGRRAPMIAAAALCALCALCALGHLAFYAKADFVALFWSALWLIAHLLQSGEPGARRRSAWLARSTIALVFLGGFMGKLTSEYWSGEILLDIYFGHKEHAAYAWARANLSASELSVVAAWLSRFTIVGEGAIVLGALSPWLSARRFFLLFTVFAGGMFAVVGPSIGGVLAPLVGLAGAHIAWIRLEEGDETK